MAVVAITLSHPLYVALRTLAQERHTAVSAVARDLIQKALALYAAVPQLARGEPRGTGLKDRQGKDIYEGSIVRRGGYTGIVFAEAGEFYVNRAGKRWDENKQMLASYAFSVYPPAEWKVIGHSDEDPPIKQTRKR
jgi:hypothetical protein